jgi:hypothetical protein
MKRVMFIFLFVLGCSDYGVDLPNQSQSAIPRFPTANDSSQAREIALWFGEELTPSDSAVNLVFTTLHEIRSLVEDTNKFSQNVRDAVEAHFGLPWAPSQLIVEVDSTAFDQIRNNQYTGWESLPLSLQPDSVSIMGPPGNFVHLRFSGFYNPWRLRDYYAGLPGVIECEPNFRMWVAIMRISWVYPGIRNGELTYLFLDHSEAQHFFVYSEGKPVYRGVWAGGAGPKPEWWEYASQCIQNFALWGK